MQWLKQLFTRRRRYDEISDDPVMLCLVPLLLFVVVLLASWLPARRAATTDPMHALRNE